MRVYMFGAEREEPVLVLLVLGAIVLANLAAMGLLRSTLSENYPKLAQKYGIDGVIPQRGFGSLALLFALIWGRDYKLANDSSVTGLVWGVRLVQIAFVGALIAAWYLSTPIR